MLAALVPLLWPGASPGGEGPLADRVDELVAPIVAAGDFSGCAIVSRGGKILARVRSGWANEEHRIPHDASTRYHLSSISKQFTAVAVLILEEDGKLAVEDPLSRHLPEFRAHGQVTLHHLLTHTSGLTDLSTRERYDAAKALPHGLDELAGEVAALPGVTPAGEVHSYSNSGYVVLARVVEVASGMPFGDFLRTRVFEPLNLASAQVHDGRTVPARLATGYDPTGATGRVRAIAPHPSVTVGAASIIASAEDLHAWVRGLGRSPVLSEASWTKMLTPYEGSYGYGIAVFGTEERPVFAHDGRQSGFCGDVSYYPEQDVAIVFLSNVQTGIGDAMRRDLGALAFGEETTGPGIVVLREGGVGAEARSAAEGRYRFFPGLDVEVRDLGGRLFARANRTGYSELVPTSDGDLFSRVTYARVEFVKPDRAGRATEMLWKIDGNAFPGARLPENAP